MLQKLHTKTRLSHPGVTWLLTELFIHPNVLRTSMFSDNGSRQAQYDEHIYIQLLYKQAETLQIDKLSNKQIFSIF